MFECLYMFVMGFILGTYNIGLDSQKIKKKPLFALCLCTTLYYYILY